MRALSASALATACRIHQVAYVENLNPLRWSNFSGAYQPDRALLDQIEERQPLVAIPLRDRDDQAKVRLDHLLLRSMVAALDPLSQLDLLRRGEEIDLADVLEEELQRLCRDLALVDLGLLDRLDDFDLQLVEPAVQLVDLRRLELELVDRNGELVGRELPGLLGARDQGLEDAFGRRWCCLPRSTPLLHRLPSHIRLVLDLVGHGASFQRTSSTAIGRTAHLAVRRS